MIFSDQQGREWDIVIHHGTAKRLKETDGFEFYALEQDKAKPLMELIDDNFGMMELIWKIIKPQAAMKEVSQDDFFSAMGGASSANARRAFLESYGNFTLSPTIQSVIKDRLRMEAESEAAMNRAMARMMKNAQKEIEKQSGNLSDESIDKMFSETLKRHQSSLNSQALPAAT